MAYDLDAVTRSYLRTLLWTGVLHYGDDREPEHLDDHYDLDDIMFGRPWIVTEARADVEDFILAIEQEGRSEEVEALWDADALGHDLALTRNGHGAGFWDRSRGHLGHLLTDLCEPMGTAELSADEADIYYE